MKNMLTKKNVLKISFAYAIFFTGVMVAGLLCHSDWCRIHDDDFLGWVFFAFLPLLPVFFFSLLIYWMRDEVFNAWISFACWFAPIIFVATLLFGGGGGGGTGISGAISGWFNAIIIGVFYLVFVVISLWRIVRAYRGRK